VEKQPAVYILASKRNGTLYIGVTSDLTKRVWEHKNDLVEDLLSATAFTGWAGTSLTRTWNLLLRGKKVLRNGNESGNWN
jgi:putative endonuclease